MKQLFAIIAAGVIAFIPSAYADSTSLILVSGHSMEPTYRDGTYLFTNNTYPFADLKTNDIITFHSKTGYEVVHRIIDIKEYEDGSMKVLTVGDNPIDQYEEWVHEDQYIGKVTS